MDNLLYFLFAIITFCELEKVSGNVQHRVVGGFEAPPKFGYFHASLQNLTGDHVCGGAVISKWHVISVAHCFASAEPQYIKIVAGTNNLKNGGITSGVSAIYSYPYYDPDTKQHDIAILKTNAPLDLSSVRIISIRQEKVVEGDSVVMTGFGAQEANGPPSSTMLALNQTVFDQQICEFAMRYSRPVTPEMFCTFSNIGQGTCHGDSGSPLVANGELVGLVSWGIPCAVGFPDVHTRISPYIGWIRKTIRQTQCAERGNNQCTQW